jgi:hypothetical protein
MVDKNLITTIANEALTPEELIERHNANPEHKITDDEIKNLKIGDKANDPDDFANVVEDKLAEDDMEHHHENNSYDILDA